MREEEQQEGLTGKRMNKENVALLLNEMQLGVKGHRED